MTNKEKARPAQTHNLLANVKDGELFYTLVQVKNNPELPARFYLPGQGDKEFSKSESMRYMRECYAKAKQVL